MRTQLLTLIVVLVFGIAAAAIETPTQVIKQAPIVIKTPEGNFDQPNFDDYKSCIKNLDSCTVGCDNDQECLDNCPKCPTLVEEAAIVQGINDTDYKPPISKSLNTTNIIRLTNEIHNFVDNNLGDVKALNTNNVTIYQKDAISGPIKQQCNDKFKMGCNEHGHSCCTVISRQKRQKLCGERCTARVMHASSVIQCADDNDLNSCDHVIEYKPYRLRRRQPITVQRPMNPCRYAEKWPFVSCPKKRIESNPCSQQCMELAYGYILQHGVPLQCIQCYKKINESPLETSAIGYAPNVDDEMPFVEDGNNWALEDEK